MSPIVYRPPAPQPKAQKHACTPPPALPDNPEDYQRWAGAIWQCPACQLHWVAGTRFWTADTAWIADAWWRPFIRRKVRSYRKHALYWAQRGNGRPPGDNTKTLGTESPMFL